MSIRLIWTIIRILTVTAPWNTKAPMPARTLMDSKHAHLLCWGGGGGRLQRARNTMHPPSREELGNLTADHSVVWARYGKWFKPLIKKSQDR